jgi:hypothetical protein
MVYRKGELSPAMVDRDWPHHLIGYLEENSELKSGDSASARKSE